MAEIRSSFALPLDEEFQLRDHPTLAHILVYISSMNGVQTNLDSQILLTRNLSMRLYHMKIAM